MVAREERPCLEESLFIRQIERRYSKEVIRENRKRRGRLGDGSLVEGGKGSAIDEDDSRWEHVMGAM